jgi:hypothetical protein
MDECTREKRGATHALPEETRCWNTRIKCLSTSVPVTVGGSRPNITMVAHSDGDSTIVIDVGSACTKAGEKLHF